MSSNLRIIGLLNSAWIPVSVEALLADNSNNALLQQD